MRKRIQGYKEMRNMEKAIAEVHQDRECTKKLCRRRNTKKIGEKGVTRAPHIKSVAQPRFWQVQDQTNDEDAMRRRGDI